eukprot:gene7721-12191_t
MKRKRVFDSSSDEDDSESEKKYQKSYEEKKKRIQEFKEKESLLTELRESPKKNRNKSKPTSKNSSPKKQEFIKEKEEKKSKIKKAEDFEKNSMKDIDRIYEYESTIESFASKNESSFLSKKQVTQLENWKKDLEELKIKLIVNLCSKELEKNWDTGFNINRENENWEFINLLIQKIENLFNKHEKTSSSDLKVLSELKTFSKERKNEELASKEQNEREWINLSFKPSLVQMKFFYQKFGPLLGKKEYSDWKGNELFSKTSKDVNTFEILNFLGC